MAELSFRIVIVPEEVLQPQLKDGLLSRVKNTVELCGLIPETIIYPQRKESENGDYPEIEGLVLDIRAKSKTKSRGPKVELYEEFCTKWKALEGLLPCSYLEFYTNDSFVTSKKSHHVSKCQKIAFGVLPHDGKFYNYADLPSLLEIKVMFYHDTRNVIIEYECFQMHFSYENIRNIFVSSSRDIYFDLFNPPIIFRMDRSRDMKYRNLNLAALGSTAIWNLTRRGRPTDREFTNPKIDVDVLGRANILSLSFKDSEDTKAIISRIHHHCSEKPVYYSHITPIPKSKPMDPTLEEMHFGCAYLITAFLKRNFLLVSQTSDIYNNLRQLVFLSRQNADSLEKALTSVLAALDSGKILNFWHAIEDQYNYYTTQRDEINFKDYIVPSKCCMIRRITLTPTRQLLWPAEIMFGNRVLRNYDSEYSIRVAFREDNMTKLSLNAMYADPGVLNACIKNPMRNGIRIGSRTFQFLAWSNSQIRDHGLWMYAMDLNGRTAASIRKWMGDFSHIHNVPKYMARMGQCFSQTEDALSVPLDPHRVRTENDIEGGYDHLNLKPYCFSDGVGKISKELAAKVHKALGHDQLCSAFQIRYGGYKGVLVIDPKLKNAEIVFRNSMKKFNCPNSTRLEIANVSSPISLQLNRPFITLLNGLGVRHRTFLRLQEEMLKNLTDMLFDEEKAAKFLLSKTPTNFFEFKDLSKSGIHLTTEPFFKSLLLALHRHHIENLKLRANIAVDPSKGRNMLGVLDETNTLCYGEVFVQYSRDISYGETTRDTIIQEGEVLVTKNPCMYPGDVRKFTAIDVPSLRHIVDCIVFPQNGPRPHPSEMSGSDLDGDEYTVLWDPELIFHRQNEPAAHFPAVHSQDIAYITVEDMIDFLEDYIKGDQVGIIASAHLAQANMPLKRINGREEPAIFSEVCLGIARKFSIAVDFAKNGHPQRLDRTERPMQYPDFMEKTHREAFKSDMALGKLYRVCKDFESENAVTSIAYEDIKVDPDLVYDGWEIYKDNALKARNKYNALFRSVLRNYGVQHEAEALSGAFTNLHCRFQERKDRNEIEKVIIGCIKKLNKSMLEEFLEEFLQYSDVASIDTKMLQKASAWYVVTYSEPNARFLSFPWTVSKYLINIKLRKTFGKLVTFSPAILNLDQKILECYNKLPNYVETAIWNNYYINCDRNLVKLALRTLMLWGQEEEIIERPGHVQGLLFVNVFIQLFLHVADLLGYVTSRQMPRAKSSNAIRKQFSAAHLCVEFLKFCSTLRFYNKKEIVHVVPFTVYKYSQLAKRAIITYHTFALTGNIQAFNFDRKVEEELIRMKPIHIESKIFKSVPIPEDALKKAENALLKYSKVEELTLREVRQTKKVIVSAAGSEQAIKELKTILRKKHVVLEHLFKYGSMPEQIETIDATVY